MTAKDAFKTGFLMRCAAEGLTLAETHARVKQAGAWDALKTLGPGALITGLVAPPVIGAGLGYTAGRLGDVDDADIKEIKQQEVLDELRQQAERLRLQHALRAKHTRPPTGRPLTR